MVCIVGRTHHSRRKIIIGELEIRLLAGIMDIPSQDILCTKNIYSLW